MKESESEKMIFFVQIAAYNLKCVCVSGMAIGYIYILMVREKHLFFVCKYLLKYLTEKI